MISDMDMWHTRWWLSLAVLSLSLLASLSGWLLSVQANPTPPAVLVDPELDGFVRYKLQPGTPFHVILQTPVHTGVNHLNDTVEVALSNTLYLGQTVLFGKNTRMNGRISKLDLPIHGRNAVLQIRFDELMLENGERLPIQAYVKTEFPDHTWGGELTPGTKPKVVVHNVWGIGQYGKTVMRGPRAMGTHIEWLPGERWTVILEQPVSIVLPKPPEDIIPAKQF